MSIAKFHAEWLNLIEVDGPFLTLPVLAERLRSGLEPTDPDLVAELHTAQREVEDDPTLQPVWSRWVITRLLGFPDEVLREGAAIGPSLTLRVAEHSQTLRPDFAIVERGDDGTERARLIVNLWPVGTDLVERPAGERWAASPIDRTAELCRATTVRLGLVTNGDTWTLVDAPVDGTTGTATWDATLWAEERTTLDAFVTLLGVRRFFTVADNETLEALLAQSANAEAEVTDQLGRQVRAAVELLVDAMSRADRERGGAVFRDLAQAELDQDLEPYIYEAAVTVLMRLVFLLSAEERGLFLLGDPTYDATYAVSTLLALLEEDASRYGEDVLERRADAWYRLLATFRIVHAGAAHANLRLPPYGGTLFDPDRFPFLEGRFLDDRAHEPASPLRIDNRTIKHILDALQVLRFRGKGGWHEARRLSFRTLGVEQIGHVYEGLLDHGVVQVSAEAVALGGKNEPEVALELIEAAAAKGHDALVSWLAELTGDKASAIDRALAVIPATDDLDRLASACDNDPDLSARIAPYLGLLRTDLRGLPQVYLADSYYVTKSSDRRASGAYYTPRALAEEMVTHTLEPLVFKPGPGEGAQPDTWKLKTSLELLDLRVCDMAMGSGAFLVSACRYLSERLLEAWGAEAVAPGDLIRLSRGTTTPMPDDETDREVLARRVVADRCLYGVDRNPMAVEMAKLSLWLITLAKDRPFTFVDHALRCGDSLLGITNLRQLDSFHLDPVKGRQLHGGTLFDPANRIEPAVKAALEKRRELESFPVIDIHDAQRKRQLLKESNALLDDLKVIGNLIVGAALTTASERDDALNARLQSVADDVVVALDPDGHPDDRGTRVYDLDLKALYWLDDDRRPLDPSRRCFHWVLEFPEVFTERSRAGFDALIGNPPFVSGTNLLPVFGRKFREYLVGHLGHGVRGTRGQVDLCAYFFLRAFELLAHGGRLGLVATNTIGQGDTKEVGLDRIVAEGGVIFRADPTKPWPGAAGLEVAQVWITKPESVTESPAILAGRVVARIDARLSVASGITGEPKQLHSNRGIQFQGCKLQGDGFLLTPDEAAALLELDPRNSEVVRPFLNGQDLNSRPDLSASRYVIFFRDWTESIARGYPDCFRIVEERVKPERVAAGREGWRRSTFDRWWQFREVRPTLFSAVDGLIECPAIAVTSNTVMPAMIDATVVPSHAVVFFAARDPAVYPTLLSGFHFWWAWTYGSTMRNDLRYTPTSCFETLPFPSEANLASSIAVSLNRFRGEILLKSGLGLTATYNRFHSSEAHEDDILELRRLHVELDNAVRDAYGWDDLDLDHGLHETRHGHRFTFGAVARDEVLNRLLLLNQERWAGERESGLLLSSGKAPRRVRASSSSETLF